MNLRFKKKRVQEQSRNTNCKRTKAKTDKKNNENKKAICKSRNGECGNGERGIFRMANL